MRIAKKRSFLIPLNPKKSLGTIFLCKIENWKTLIKKTEIDQIEYPKLLDWLNLLTLTKNKKIENNFVICLKKLFILLFNLLKSLPNKKNALFSI